MPSDEEQAEEQVEAAPAAPEYDRRNQPNLRHRRAYARHVAVAAAAAEEDVAEDKRVWQR